MYDLRRHEHPATHRAKPDLSLGHGADKAPEHLGRHHDRRVVQHSVRTTLGTYVLLLHTPAYLGPRPVVDALREAVAELRAIDLTYGPGEPRSLVARLRRDEISADSYPPLADLVDRCAAMRAATDGWFDAWAVPGGFDPSGLLVGWAAERAADRLREAGVHAYAVRAGADLTVAGRSPRGGPWRIAVHDPAGARRHPLLLELTSGAIGTSGVSGRRDHVYDPHTGQPAREMAATTVLGPNLSVADVYATALFAAGPAGLDWFPTADGYQALVTTRR